MARRISRQRITGAFVVLSLVPLATALFVRPAPAPPRLDRTSVVAASPATADTAGSFSIDAVRVNNRAAENDRDIHVRDNDFVDVVGWALDPRSMERAAKLQIAIDGQRGKTDAAYGLNRPDVAAVFHNTEAGPSGFHARIRIRHLAGGKHVLRLFVRGDDGLITDVPTAISFIGEP